MAGILIESGLGIAPLLLTIIAFTIPLLSLIVKNKMFYHIYALVFSLLAMGFTVINYYLVNHVYRHPITYCFGGWPAPIGIVYTVDGVGSILGLLIGVDMILIVLYSWWYMRCEEGVEWYYTLLLLLEAAMLGIVYTGDLFNLFVMIELLAISAYGLVAFYRNRHEAIEAAIKYSLIGATATTMFFLAIVYVYATYGTVNMADLALKARQPWICSNLGEACGFFENISGTSYGNPILATAISIALSLWAFTFKAAVFPNHFWLPDAHPEAPTPVSAALSGLVVKMGAYATLRLVYTVFGINTLIDMPVAGGMSLRDIILYTILILGAVSAIIGSLVMIIQTDIKRILAYSTIAHLGIIFMAIGVGLHGSSNTLLALAMTGIVLHIINHSFGKILAFLASGVYIKATGTRNIYEMKGIGRIMPATSIALIIGLLHLLGVPPFGGFFSKLMIFNALMQAGLVLYAIILILSTAISILGYMRIIVNIILPSKPSNLIRKVHEHPLIVSVFGMLVAFIVTMGIMGVFGGIDYLSYFVGSTATTNGIEDYIRSATNSLSFYLGR